MLFSFISISVFVLLSKIFPLNDSGLKLLKELIISFFILYGRVSGHVTDKIKLVLVCSIIHKGIKTDFISFKSYSVLFLKLLILIEDISKYFSNLQLVEFSKKS